MKNAWWIARWYQCLGQVDAAVAYLSQEMRLKTLNMKCNQLQVQLLLESRAYEEAFKLLRKLEAEVSPNERVSKLVECFFDVFEFSDITHLRLRRAAQWVQKTDYLNHYYELAIQQAKKEEDVGPWAMIRTWYAQFLLELHIDLDRAIRIWEQVVKHGAVVQYDWMLATARPRALEQLTMVEFSKAFAAYRARTDSGPFVTAMERLTNERASVQTHASNPYETENSTLVLASFYKIQGRLEDAKTRLRPLVNSALDILTDDDEDNDWLGFRQLALTLYRIGDDLNATAAWHLMCISIVASPGHQRRDAADEARAKIDEEGEGEGEGDTYAQGDGEGKAEEAHLDIAQLHISDAVAGEQEYDSAPACTRANNQPSTSPVTVNDPAPAQEIEYPNSVWQEVVRYMVFGSCDGPCGSNLGPDSGNHWCRYCADYVFCDECFQTLQAGNMPYRVCDPTHDFYTRTFPAKSPPKGVVRVGDQVRPIPEWLDDLRKAWTAYRSG